MHFCGNVIRQIKLRLGREATREYISYRLQKTISKKRFPCPFCGSKASCGVYENKNKETRFKCFNPNCQKEGDLIDFEQYLSNVDRKEAIRIVAEYAEIPFYSPTNGKNIIIPVKTLPQHKNSLKNDLKPIKRELDEKPASMEELPRLFELSHKAEFEELERYFRDNRHFNSLSSKAAEIATKIGVRIIDNTLDQKGNRVRDYTKRTIKNLLSGIYFVFHIVDENNNIIGCECIPTDSLRGQKTKKHKVKLGSSKGILIIDQGSQIVFIVESVANAVALACLGYSAVVLFSATNADTGATIAKKLLVGRQLVFWLDRGIEEYQNKVATKHNLQQILWNTSLTKGYDQNDLLADQGKTFLEVVAQYLTQLKPEIQHLDQAQITRRIVPTMENAICHQPNTVNLVTAYTGVGKTYRLVEALEKDYSGQKTATAFTDTVNNAENLHLSLKDKIGKDAEKDTLLVVSKREESTEKDLSKEKIRRINTSTYGYLGFAGHKPHIYGVAGYSYENTDTGDSFLRDGLTTTDHLYCDEFHNIFEHIRVEYALRQAYVKRETNVEFWQKSDEYQSWQPYIFAHWPKMKDWNRFEYPSDIATESVSIQTKPKSLDFIGKTFEELQQPSNYQKVFGTLFSLSLSQNSISTEIPVPPLRDKDCKSTEYDFLKKLFRYLYNPKILIEFPIRRDTGEPLTQEQINKMFEEAHSAQLQKYLEKYPENQEKAKELATKEARNIVNRQIKVPVNAAYVPVLVGYNLLPLIQLMKRSVSINALSATLDEKHKQILAYAASLCGWKMQETVVTEVPFQFPIRVMKMFERITCADQAKILRKLIDGKITKTLIVVYKKANAQTVYTEIKQSHRDVALFKERNYETSYLDTKSDKSNIVTYPNAAILQGENLFLHNNVIIDCGMFIKRAALDLDTNANKEQINENMSRYIAKKLVQTIGRLLRDKNNDQRKPGQTLQSEKLITILLHNLPEELANFTIDKNLISSYQEVKESDSFRFFSKQTGQIDESIVDTIHRQHRDEEVQNWAVIDAQKTSQEKTGKRNMSKAQREAVREHWQDEKTKLRIERLIQKGKILQIQMKSEREIYRELNLNRLSVEERQAILKALGFDIL